MPLAKPQSTASCAVTNLSVSSTSLANLGPIILGNVRVEVPSGLCAVAMNGVLNFASGEQYRNVECELKVNAMPNCKPLTTTTTGLTDLAMANIMLTITVFTAWSAYSISSIGLGGFPPPPAKTERSLPLEKNLPPWKRITFTSSSSWQAVIKSPIF